MASYVKTDYQSIVDRITGLLSSKPGWGEGYQSSMGQTLIQLNADSVDHLHYMLERRSQEAYISTARLASSIRAKASDFGYIPRRKVSSTGTLQLTLTNSDGDIVSAIGTVSIPMGTSVLYNDTRFITTEDSYIAPGESSVNLVVKEGVFRSEIFDFDEEPYLSDPTILFTDYVDIEEYSLKVGTDDVLYTYVRDTSSSANPVGAMSFAGSTDAVYDIKFSTDGLRIVFGDGIFGQKPTSLISVTWVESSGSEVDVIKTGLNFSFDRDYLEDDVNTVPRNQYSYELINTTPIRGGKDEESIEEIRTNVPSYLRTNNRCVTNFDYEFWGLKSGIGNIVDISAYGEHEIGTLIYKMNSVYLAYVTNDGLQLTTDQKKAMLDYIGRLKVITTHIVLKYADEIPLQVVIDFKKHPDLPISDAQLYVLLRNAVNDYFAIGRGSISKDFQHSEFVRYMQELKTTFNGIVYQLTDYVKVVVNGLYPIELPQQTYDGLLTLSNTYTPVEGDRWTVTINGSDYNVFVGLNDTITDMVIRMRDLIFTGTDLMVATPNYNTIRLKEARDVGTFTVSVAGGTISSYVDFEQYIQIPKPTAYTTATKKILYPGSVQILNEEEEVIMQDNSNGELVATEGLGYPNTEVDYTKALIKVPSIPDGKYFVRFQQNIYQNFDSARDGVLVVSDIRASDDTSTDHFFSRINLIQ